MILTAELVDRLRNTRVLVVGDAMRDVYHYCTATRMSQEAPVPVLVEQGCEARRGGADNVLHQCEQFTTYARGLFPERRCEKHRYLVDGRQVMRLDVDRQAPEDWAHPFSFATEIARADVLVVSDYGKGAVTRGVLAALAPHVGGRHVIVDPDGSGDWDKYAALNAVMCPNDVEYLSWLGCESGWRPTVVHKRGAAGIDIVRGDLRTNYPAQVRGVRDVTGAGDVVVAVVACMLGAGAPLEDAVRLANLAAGYAVEHVGTTVCPMHELVRLCE